MIIKTTEHRDSLKGLLSVSEQSDVCEGALPHKLCLSLTVMWSCCLHWEEPEPAAGHDSAVSASVWGDPNHPSGMMGAPAKHDMNGRWQKTSHALRRVQHSEQNLSTSQLSQFTRSRKKRFAVAQQQPQQQHPNTAARCRICAQNWNIWSRRSNISCSCSDFLLSDQHANHRFM